MLITKIQIEGGFLQGFDLEPAPGLTVIIGARGTGKTSVIELIRYGLGSKNHTAESQVRSIEHARAVLDGGEVTISLEDGTEDVTVSRDADDDEPRCSRDFGTPIVLSQTEIETLGLSSAGRLSLLDGFVANRAALRAKEGNAVTAVRSVYREIAALESEVSSLREGLDKLPLLTTRLVESEQQSIKLQGDSSATASKQKRLNKLNADSSSLSVRDEMLGRFAHASEEWASELDRLEMEDFGPEAWDGDAAEDPLKKLRPKYLKAVEDVVRVSKNFKEIQAEATAAQAILAASRTEIDKNTRALRVELEKLAEGAGAVAREIGQIKTQIAQLQSRQKLLTERTAKLNALRKKRDERLAELRTIRSTRSTLRTAAATEITTALSPHIKVEVDRDAEYSAYTQALATALRGSGLKYNDLSLALSERVSPQELMEFIDSDDFISLSGLVGIPKDRAARLTGHLREAGIADIITANVDDNVRLTLLDGVEYKEVEALSAGQRCTVVLSIVLQHKGRVLVIDQPEDHLDNAFIADTVIKALRERKPSGQVLVSTHNANIPVLGEADLVVELTSDGRNGFIQVCAPLNDANAVRAITNVMEGGKEAFRRRAEFYQSHEH